MYLENYDFATTTHGKWILLGEHAVLRGCPAIIFPVKSRFFKLAYYDTQQQSELSFTHPGHEVLANVFWRALNKATELANQSTADINGHFVLSNTIPISMGMGASAALCVAISRWLIWRGWLAEPQLFEFAKTLESLFHNESSGADIAACMANAGIHFLRQGSAEPIQMNWQPTWYLSHSGICSETALCVKQVKELLQRDPTLGQQIDADMRHSVVLAETALASPRSQGLSLLTQAIELGYHCFKRWGLAEGPMADHLAILQAAGAIAVKPTGSGGGGFALSLWEQKPSSSLPFEMIQL